jgi:hypothetical protein
MVDGVSDPSRLQARRAHYWTGEGTMADSEDGLETADSAASTGRRRATGGFAAGLLIGALLGASLALLYAPERGSRTRHELRRRLRQLREEAGAELERAGGGARRELRRRRRQIEDGLERARDRLE